MLLANPLHVSAVPLLITKLAMNNYEFVFVRISDWKAAMLIKQCSNLVLQML